MKLGKNHLDYLVRTHDEEDLKNVLSWYDKRIEMYRQSRRLKDTRSYESFKISEQKCLRGITEKALKIIKSEVKNESL